MLVAAMPCPAAAEAPRPRLLSTGLDARIEPESERATIETLFVVDPDGARELPVVLTAFTPFEGLTLEARIGDLDARPLALRESAPGRWEGELPLPPGTGLVEPLTVVLRYRTASALERVDDRVVAHLSLPRLAVTAAGGAATFRGSVVIGGGYRLRDAFPGRGRWDAERSALVLELPATPGLVRLALDRGAGPLLTGRQLVDLGVVVLLLAAGAAFVTRLRGSAVGAA